MQLLFILFMALALVGGTLARQKRSDIDRPQVVVDAQAQLAQYRTFLLVSTLYMRGYSDGAKSIGWDTLRTAPGAPTGAINAGMPAGWKIVVASDNSWVACTALDDRTVAALPQFATPAGQSVMPSVVNGNNYVVVGSSADSGKASLCN